ncbi:GspH/FimT family pseudopilin [Sapientia aquatica]|uniref:Type II secretion system protein H n=1 Tax=Sapientia aquatica TaxID=1549640 RepID=A0A4R5W4K8_9BURK|nr:GspH/FimT family pseudopilin [Sapientia aquatica]TDK68022.1 prepilin-type N-terminal cleavage/methylation domain-containing protein [Sapientia aquatica]
MSLTQQRYRPSTLSPSQRERGFSLVELMIALAIGTILLMIAAPQFNSAIQTQQSNTEVTNLMMDMQYARSEAIKEGQNVTICASTDGASCSGTTWNSGWIIFSNISAASPAAFTKGTDVKLRVQPSLTTKDTITSSPATNSITYNRDGFGVNFGNATGQLFTLHNAPINNAATRCLFLDALGRQKVYKYGDTPATGFSCS